MTDSTVCHLDMATDDLDGFVGEINDPFKFELIMPSLTAKFPELRVGASECNFSRPASRRKSTIRSEASTFMRGR
jgi:hypothetical protein